MIKDIMLLSFQSHDGTTIKLDGNFTAIVGSSNSGKSSIFRALKLVSQNSGSAASMVTHGAKQFQIAVGTDDNHTVRMFRGKSLSTYEIDGTEYAKCGVGTPEIVERTLHLSALNFASQFDVPFMVAESPTEVAARISELTGSETLRAAAREANRLRLEVSAKAKDRRSKLTEILDVLKVELPAFKAAEAAWETAQAKADQAKVLHERAYELRATANRLRGLQIWVEQNTAVVGNPDAALTLLDQASIKLIQSIEIRSLAKKIEDDFVACESFDRAISDLEGSMKRSQVELSTIMEGLTVCPTCLQTIG